MDHDQVRKFLSSLFLLCTCGCATHVWYQTGRTPGDTERDLAECKYNAESQSNPLAMVNGWFWLGDQARMNALVEDCMKAKGYHWVKQSEVPSHPLGPQKETAKVTPASTSTRLDAKPL